MTDPWIAPEALPASALSPAASSLRDAALRLAAERFAVLDGARFADPAARLSAFDLTGRPLFLEAADPQTVANGPFLVLMPEEHDLDRLLACVGEERLPVIWSWPAGEAALYRHLRTLNLCEIPAVERASPDAPAYETVIFRHWDGVVLGQMLPLLGPEQSARFFGQSGGLALDAGAAAGIVAWSRPTGLPAAGHGLLRFSPEQVGGSRAARLHESRLKVLRYLEEVDPEALEGLDGPARFQRILEYERSGTELGLESERAQMKWAYLMGFTAGAAAGLPEVRRILLNPQTDPEEALDVILDRLDDAWVARGFG